MPVTTNLGRVMSYHEGLRPIKTHDPLTMWSYEITWQNIVILTPLPESL